MNNPRARGWSEMHLWRELLKPRSHSGAMPPAEPFFRDGDYRAMISWQPSQNLPTDRCLYWLLGGPIHLLCA